MVQLENGYPFDSTDFSGDGGVPLVRIRDLSASRFETFVPGPVDPRVMLAKDDLVIGMDGDFNVVRWTREPAALNQRLCRLRARGNADIRFVEYSLPTALAWIHQTQYATTVKHLSSSEVLSSRVPQPPFDEQRRIADFLDDQVARIDNIIVARETQRELIEQARRSELDNAITLGELRRSRLARFADVQTGVTIDASRTPKNGRRVPYLRVANVQAGSLALGEVKLIDLDESRIQRASLQDGDVLMTEGGDIDKLGRGTVWRSPIQGTVVHQNHVFAVRVDRRRMVPEYLAYVTACSDARMHFEQTASKTTNLASTSASKVMDLPVPVRSLAAQERVVHELDMLTSHTRRADRALGESGALLHELKRSLITAAVSGEFDVSAADGSQVPVDVPAGTSAATSLANSAGASAAAAPAISTEPVAAGTGLVRCAR